MRRRTRSRELALQFLYQVDLVGEDAMRDVNDFLDAETKEPDVRAFALELIQGTWAKHEEIDVLIRRIAKNWDIKRMAAIDRNVLRLAIWEIQQTGAAPPKVVINEAIELGKRFSTQHSGKFINGILDRAKEILLEGRPLPPETGAPKPPVASGAPAVPAVPAVPFTPLPTPAESDGEAVAEA